MSHIKFDNAHNLASAVFHTGWKDTCSAGLTAEDGSVGRLDSICQALGITLLDLLQIAGSESPAKEFSLPLPVQEYFLENLDCFRAYWILIYDECPPTEAARALGMREAEFLKHARQLDRFGLLTIGAENRITLPKRDHIVWINEGPLVDWLRRNWSRSLLDTVVKGKDGTDNYLSLRFLRLTQASCDGAESRGLSSERGEKDVRASPDLRKLQQAAPTGFIRSAHLYL